jgi:hypothetical protein
MRQYVPNPILRSTTRIHSNSKAYHLAWYQPSVYSYIRLPPRTLFRLVPLNLPNHVELLRWKSTSLRGTLHR